MAGQTVGARPEEIDIDVTAGEPVDFTVPVVDDDGLQLNPSGWTGLAQVRPHPGGPLLHIFTVAVSADGFGVSATGEDTAGWAAWRSPLARWDLWVTPPGEESRPLTRGRVFVRSPISEVSS